MKKLASAFAILALATTAAQARGHHYHHRYHVRHYHHGSTPVKWDGNGFGHNVRSARAQGLPWCGAWLADQFGLPRMFNGLNLWQAAEWRKMGQPSEPHVGAIVVWSHHVGKIVGQENGRWVIESGNDGHAVRRRERSIAGASIRSIG